MIAATLHHLQKLWLLATYINIIPHVNRPQAGRTVSFCTEDDYCGPHVAFAVEDGRRGSSWLSPRALEVRRAKACWQVI